MSDPWAGKQGNIGQHVHLASQIKADADPAADTGMASDAEVTAAIAVHAATPHGGGASSAIIPAGPKLAYLDQQYGAAPAWEGYVLAVLKPGDSVQVEVPGLAVGVAHVQANLFDSDGNLIDAFGAETSAAVTFALSADGNTISSTDGGEGDYSATPIAEAHVMVWNDAGPLALNLAPGGVITVVDGSPVLLPGQMSRSVAAYVAPLADPPTATAQDVATALNSLLTALVAAGLMESS